MRSITFLPQEQQISYDNKEIEHLCEHFGESKNGQAIDPQATKLEWKLVKPLVVTEMYPRDSTQMLWQIISKAHPGCFPNLETQIAIVLPLQTADVERGFSVQNQIKTKLRNQLTPKTVNQLMLVCLEGGSHKKFDFDPAIEHWRSEKKRNIFH